MRFWIFLLAFQLPLLGWAEMGQGIYIRQPTLENDSKLKRLIKNATEVGIDTFVVDIDRPSKLYEKQIAKVKKAGLKYVARIVMFPGGGLAHQVKSQSYWKSKYK